MRNRTSSAHAFGYAFVTLASLLGGFYYLWFVARLPFFHTELFLIIICLLTIALLTVIVFQSARLASTASLIAQGMAEDMLMYSKELFTELYRGSPVPYLLINDDSTVDSTNLAALRLFGVEDGWFQGKYIFEYLKEEKEDGNRLALIPEYFKKKVSVNDEELMIVRRDGATRWVLLSLFSFTDARRKHKGLLTLVDVTKQKEIDKAKTEFVSLASHQLRTPISSMKWNMELLEVTAKERLNEKELDNLEKIERGIERMDILVTDFLSVSKLELGTLVPNMVSIPFAQFVESILESHESKASARGITITRKWEADDTVVGDTHLLEMAVNNLISNAVKYSRDGGEVTIAFATQNNVSLIEVKDTGIGIPEEEHDKIFQKIFRASNAKAEVPDGTGLGLYIVREAVRVMGGDVTFTSELGRGTTFTISLPVT